MQEYSEYVAGRPVRRAALNSIAAIGGIRAILARISEGESITKIAEGLGVSRAMLSELLNSPANLPALRAARALAAAAFAEQSIEIADSAEPGTVAVARLRLEARWWLASRWDREAYGAERNATGVTVNLAQIHADTLRQIGAEERAKRAKEIEAQFIAADGTSPQGFGHEICTREGPFK